MPRSDVRERPDHGELVGHGKESRFVLSVVGGPRGILRTGVI